MKIRNGFVSNSSSSSYLIAAPTEHAMEKDIIREVMGVKAGSAGAKFLDPIIDFLLCGKSVDLEYLASDNGMTVEEFEEEYKDNKALKFLKDGWKVLRVSAHSDESDPIHQMLYYGEVEVDAPSLKIVKEY